MTKSPRQTAASWKGDPAARVADIENVEIVFDDGVGYDTKKLLESVKGR